MTRETKVGLVVGTGIILLIGIVVSDHLASQQRGHQQVSAPPGYTDLGNGNPRTINPSGVRPVEAVTKDRQPLPTVGEDRRTNPVVGIINYGADGSVIPPAPGTNNAVIPPAPGPAIADRNLPGPGNGNTPNPLPPGLRNELRNNNLLPEDNTPREANNGGTTTSRPTEPLIHHVQPGDSLWAIAEKYYGVGNGRYSSEIARANHEVLLPDGGVRVGVRLIIPNKAITTPGSSVAGAGDRNTGAPAAPGIITPPTPPGDAGAVRPALKTVKVEPGDSLSAIASRSLGSVKHMQLIIDANKDLIHDADDIKAGMTLRIPELPAPTPVPPTVVRAPTTPPTTPTPASAAKVHKVQPRETFTSIARTRLGSERRWKEVFDLNKAQVSNPDALKEGIVLVLPSDARP